MIATPAPDRCRIVLIAPDGFDTETLATKLSSALAGGDVASLILPDYGMDEAAFQRRAERIVPLVQEKGVAVMIAGDFRVAMRTGADGVHLEARRKELEEAIEKHQAKLMIGTGGAKTRDDALELGEARPDYIFFGRFGYDTKPEPHSRNLTLGGWWSEMVQIPCIVLAGSDLASVEAVAATGADFVALSSAVFGGDADPAAAIRRANAILDEKAPRFED
ncbi:thiamine phosphate synthase [Aquamicrobium sp. LC103]|uniref:thiamine phosphate synthase n=1 Tax=Aquamicrobium sp. LC103 TaxID=1120658 RepID=UPI00063EB30C|nr:thiamine phosphate synthase [Aquamicrobium sp. LC103]TKT75381.1 thiamine phosphate synthase [Aquamicrobium sp. LC103]